MVLLPGKRQWSNWSLVSKAGYLGAWFGALSILLAIIALLMYDGSKKVRIEPKEGIPRPYELIYPVDIRFVSLSDCGVHDDRMGRNEDIIEIVFGKLYKQIVRIYGKSLFYQVKQNESLEEFSKKLIMNIDSSGRVTGMEIEDNEFLGYIKKCDVGDADSELIELLESESIQFRNLIGNCSKIVEVFFVHQAEHNIVIGNSSSEQGLQLTMYRTIGIRNGMRDARSFILSNPSNRLILIKEIRAVVDEYGPVQPTCEFRGFVGETKFEIGLRPSQKVYTFAQDMLKYSPGDADKVSIVFTSGDYHYYIIHFEIEWYFSIDSEIHKIVTLSDRFIFDQ